MRLNIGPRLTLCFVFIILAMLGGDAVVLWQFHEVRLQANRLNGFDQELVAVLRVHASLMAFHDELEAIANYKDAGRLAMEAGAMNREVLEETQRARAVLAMLPDGAQADPTIVPTLEVVQRTFQSELNAIVGLAKLKDWEAVHLRLTNQVHPLEVLSSSLVERMDHEVGQEQARAATNIRRVERRVFLIIPLSLVVTLLVAGILGAAITRSITLPLSRLVEGSKKLARGEFQHRVSIPGDNELADLGLVFNNSARQLQELYADLQRSEERLRKVINAVPAIITSTLPDGSVDFVNDRLLEYTGRTAEDLRGWHWENVLHPDDQAVTVGARRRSLELEEPLEKEVRMRRADGEYRWFLARNAPLRDEEGKIVKWYSTLTDIEDRKRAEHELRTSMFEQMRLSAVREEIGMALASKGSLRGTLHQCVDALVRHLDAAFARIWMLDGDGRTLELQASAGMYTHLDGRHSRIALGDLKIGRIAQEKKPHLTNDLQNDTWVSDPDWAKKEKITSFAGYPLVVEDRVVGVMGMFSQRELTQGTLNTLAAIADGIAQGIERKRTEDALRHSEAYLAEAQRLSHTGSFGWQIPTGELLWSEETYHIFEYEIGKKPTLEFIIERTHPDDRDFVRQLLERTAGEGKGFDAEHRLLMQDGTVKYLHVVAHGLKDSSGALEFVGAVTDITQATEAEEALRKAQADLAHINRVTMMGELTASLAHEIQQPITAAVTNARTCLRWLQREPPDIGGASDAASRIVKDANRAADIINRTRSLYRRDSPKREMINLNQLIREMSVLLHDAAIRHSVSIRADVDEELPLIAVDRVQMQQVLMNLMLNGIEAMTDTGGGELTIRANKTVDDQVLLSVSDLGVGLPAENSERIYDAFFTTKAQGTGMGLSITRRIIESYGGRLWASTNTEGGATFHFTLPADPAADASYSA